VDRRLSLISFGFVPLHPRAFSDVSHTVAFSVLGSLRSLKGVSFGPLSDLHACFSLEEISRR